MTDFKKATFNQNPTPGSSQNVNQQMAKAGNGTKRSAPDVFGGTSDVVGDKLKGATEAVEDQAREQQRESADFVERLADNIREAARAFESDVPFAARGINSAAGYVENAAEKLRNGSFRDLVDGATDFAKRQPAAFLGVSVLAGFAAVRFLRASGGQSSSSQRGDRKNMASAPEAKSHNKSPVGSTPSEQGFSRPVKRWEPTPTPSSRGSDQ
jgi:hypothetical protein